MNGVMVVAISIRPLPMTIVSRHNYYRSLDFQDSKLTWDETFGTPCTTVGGLPSNTLHTGKRSNAGTSPHASKFNSPEHGLPYEREGENIAWASGGLNYVLDEPVDISKAGITNSQINGKFGAIDMWANEKAYYDYETNSGNGYVVGHYTQVVWQKTTKVGCGEAKSQTDRDGSYVVCRYLYRG